MEQPLAEASATDGGMEVPAVPAEDLAAVVSNLAKVQDTLKAAMAARPATPQDGRVAPPEQVRLVAVSKLKAAEMLVAAYEAGQRHFGENYVQEVLEKAPRLPQDVHWHFIGHLQSNKVNVLVKGCPGLVCVETVDTEKLAHALNKAVQARGLPGKLRVMVQVNTSSEESKSGVTPDGCLELCTLIFKDCDALELAGLMTIGAPDYSGCRTEDFQTLHRCRQEVAVALDLEPSSLELSMGMSNDYEQAIIEGSSSVRVGSAIFGARPPKSG